MGSFGAMASQALLKDRLHCTFGPLILAPMLLPIWPKPLLIMIPFFCMLFIASFLKTKYFILITISLSTQFYPNSNPIHAFTLASMY